MMQALQDLRDSLALIPDVASCRIGMENGIAPSDYPLIRIVPSRIAPGRPYSHRTAECQILFGMDITAAEAGGLEAVYAALFALEAAILDRLRLGGHRYIETLTDEDRSDAYKLMAVRADIVSGQPAP